MTCLNPIFTIFKLPYRKPTQQQPLYNRSSILYTHISRFVWQFDISTMLDQHFRNTNANWFSTKSIDQFPTNKNNSFLKRSQKYLSESEQVEETLWFYKKKCGTLSTNNLANFQLIIQRNQGRFLSVCKTESCSVSDQWMWHMKKPKVTDKSLNKMAQSDKNTPLISFYWIPTWNKGC